MKKTNNDIKNKIQLDLLINEYIKKEKNSTATALKAELIKDLLKKELKYINVIEYYYNIKNLNNE